MTSSNTGARYFSLFLMVFVFALNGILFAWISSSIPRPPAKRAAALAIINSIGNGASIWTPFTYKKQDAPHYKPALGICIALLCIAAASAASLRLLLIRHNKRLERMQDEDSTLTARDLKILERTAEVEGVTLAEARVIQKNYRFVV